MTAAPLTAGATALHASLSASVSAAINLTRVAQTTASTAIREAAKAPAAVAAGPARVAQETVRGAVRHHVDTWPGPGRAHFPLVLCDDAAAAADERASVTAALADLPGVEWVRADPGLRRIVVRFDERQTTPTALREAVAAVQAAAVADRPTRGRDTRRGNPLDVSPFEEGPVRTRAVGLALSCAGLAGALVNRTLRLPGLPTIVTASVVLADYQPRLRRLVEQRLGPTGSELAFAAATASVHALNGGWSALAVEAAARLQSLTAARARREGFISREDDLCGPRRPVRTAPIAHRERVQPLPPGPVERLADRAASGSVLAAVGLGAATRSPNTAARAILIGAPKAARFGPQSFAETIGTGWARHGVLPLDPNALSRLDRVTAVVIDAATLLTSRPLVIGATATAEHWTSEHVWSAAQRLLAGDRTLPVPPPRGRDRERLQLVGGPLENDRGATEILLTEDGEAVGTVLVGREIDPYAIAVLSAARRAGRLILSADESAAELAAHIDRVVPVGDDPANDLAGEIRRLQEAGEVVAVLSEADEALATADLAVAIVNPGRPVPWGADVLCTNGLADAARVFDTIPAAAAVSHRGATLAYGGMFLGALVSAVGSRRRGTGTFPVNAAAASALATGYLTARRVLLRAAPAAVPQVPWHALEADDVLARLHSDAEGHGPAHFGTPSADRSARKPIGELGRLARNVRAELADPLTPVLGTGAAASAIIGSAADALLVSGVLAANAVISGAQRLRAENAIRPLLGEQRLTAQVVDCPHTAARKRLATAPADQLRPGDVVKLQAGDVVPADARLLDVDDLEIDESSLTGESGPVLKDVTATPGAELPDRACMVYEGTTVLAGTANAVVVAVGAATESGRAMQLAGQGSAAAGMQARLEEITRRGLPITLVGGAAVTGIGLLRGQSLRNALASGVSVAVAAVPEGLPLVATVAQSSAARRLSQRGVMVRSARTLEALGRVDTVCFDKTGTLTEGRLHLVRVAGLSGEWAPDAPESRRILRAAVQACPASTAERPFAHATDQAIVDGAASALGEPVDANWDPIDEIPFQSDRGYSAGLGRSGTRMRLAVKGAPEILLPRCGHIRDEDGKRPLTGSTRAAVESTMRALAEQGLRVLAVARRSLPELAATGAQPPSESLDGLAEDLTFLGFVALADVERAEAKATVAALHEAGVDTVMITGDHPITGRSIAESLGIPAGRVVTGAELDRATDDERADLVASARVFARVSPAQKLRIVAALQRSGRVVAMTGDGANDAAAIRTADVGIGMAARGSASARLAADLVLSEPDVSLICDAMVEGRALWRRVRDAVAILLGGNAGEVAFTVIGTALAGRAPIGTRQFLLVNMLTDLLPAMAIALAATPDDPAERREILTQGRPSLGSPLLREIGVRGATTAAGALVAWQIGRMTGTRRRADTMALTALVATQLGQTLLVSRRNPLVIATGLGSFATLVAIVQTPGVSRFFGCRPMGPVAWTVVTASAAGASALSVVLPGLMARLLATAPPTSSAASDQEPDTMRTGRVLTQR